MNKDSNMNIDFIDQADISNKRVLLRVDFNVSLLPDSTIADDARIRQSLPTIKYLLEKKNTLILISHLGRPNGREEKLSLRPVADRLQTLFPGYTVVLIHDFLSFEGKKLLEARGENTIYLLENIRYYPEEKKGDDNFARNLAALADVYVNDAFGVSHRSDASVVAVAKLRPAYGGLLLKKEIEMISKAIEKPEKPVAAILGGAKISTKINLIGRLMEIADFLLVGGGLANTFLAAQGMNIGNSLFEYDELEHARRLLFMASEKHTAIILPSDVVGETVEKSGHGGEIYKVSEIPEKMQILDIGPETQAKFGAIIDRAKTIIWNGPVGYIENPAFRRGTDFIYYSITQNPSAASIVGGGDTIAAISKKEYIDKITHISTGGGAMLEFIEKGTLPGIEALKR